VFVIKMDANPPSADAKPPPPSSAAKPRPASGDTKPASPTADAKKDAKKDARIAKIWTDLGAAVGQLDGEPEEMAAAGNALFNAACLRAIAVKNPPVLETFEWLAANKNIDIRDVGDAFGLRAQSLQSREDQPWPPLNPRPFDLPETASMFCSILIDNPRQN
jgi:hypothetical protein